MLAAGDPDAAARPGPLREGLATLVDALATRVDLAATEIAEQRAQLARQGLYSAITLFCGTFAAVLAVALLVLATPADQRVVVLGIVTGLAVACALACGWRMRVLARRRAPLLEATLDVLRADAAALRRNG